ncbi:MAG: STAS domain-containing protein [Rectinemataceae bacterium]
MRASLGKTMPEDLDRTGRAGLTIVLDPCPIDACCRTLVVEGQIDYYNADYFEETVADVLIPGIAKLEILCPGLRYVSWTGIAAFYRISHLLRLRGGGLVLSSARPRVFEMFDMLGVAEFITFSPPP